jgi:hypothetical protein
VSIDGFYRDLIERIVIKTKNGRSLEVGVDRRSD